MFLGSDTLLRFDLILLQVNYSFPSSKVVVEVKMLEKVRTCPNLIRSLSPKDVSSLSLNCHNIVLGSQTTCDLRGCSPALTLFDPALFSAHYTTDLSSCSKYMRQS
ncbi:hypothetical protein BLNAU_14155 [Blattamonas nauphoetae]|uniref:Uncharacterized protein n=1 Tax=Blattamonas nauphoetae TaxID=2049346 RepID=A0ABQ9XJG9_9EUKA|nr:hypothetical protein BLNAU_14155 [Blattamonas nauphoetae]